MTTRRCPPACSPTRSSGPGPSRDRRPAGKRRGAPIVGSQTPVWRRCALRAPISAPPSSCSVFCDQQGASSRAYGSKRSLGRRRGRSGSAVVPALELAWRRFALRHASRVGSSPLRMHSRATLETDALVSAATASKCRYRQHHRDHTYRWEAYRPHCSRAGRRRQVPVRRGALRRRWVQGLIGYGPCIDSTSRDWPPSW